MQISRCVLAGCVAAATALVSFAGFSSQDTDAQAKARSALEQNLSDANAQPNPKPEAPATQSQTKPSKPDKAKSKQPAPDKLAAKPAAKSTATAPAKDPAGDFSKVDLPASANQGDMDKVQKVLQEQMATTPTPAPTPKSEHAKAEKSKLATDPAAMPSLPPPPPAVNASKQQRLDALLQQYKADKLTPHEYHEQRAKILAGP